jgi:hypothetical protein
VLFIAVYSTPNLYVTGIFQIYIFLKTTTKPELFRTGHALASTCFQYAQIIPNLTLSDSEASPMYPGRSATSDFHSVVRPE